MLPAAPSWGLAALVTLAPGTRINRSLSQVEPGQMEAFRSADASYGPMVPALGEAASGSQGWSEGGKKDQTKLIPL